ncbi:MAG: hypothetical protein LBM23_10660 [Propionibacteriaceae bacterium]|jgi:hypothetical protein|nr:hypothetical protein [Propionibacteriaceae bacterium]
MVLASDIEIVFLEWISTVGLTVSPFRLGGEIVEVSGPRRLGEDTSLLIRPAPGGFAVSEIAWRDARTEEWLGSFATIADAQNFISVLIAPTVRFRLSPADERGVREGWPPLAIPRRRGEEAAGFTIVMPPPGARPKPPSEEGEPADPGPGDDVIRIVDPKRRVTALFPASNLSAAVAFTHYAGRPTADVVAACGNISGAPLFSSRR